MFQIKEEKTRTPKIKNACNKNELKSFFPNIPNYMFGRRVVQWAEIKT